ncbi:hypothetical protein D3C75_779930 [compost metagenome]
MGKGAQLLDLLRYCREMAVIDAGDQHRVDLAADSPLRHGLDAFHLAVDKQLRRILAAVNLPFVGHPIVDMLANLRVYGIDGNRHMVDACRRNLIGEFRKPQAVGAEA